MSAPTRATRRRTADEDPFLNPERAAGATPLAAALSSARQAVRRSMPSLLRPSPPRTPQAVDGRRSLFQDPAAESPSRPGSSADPLGSQVFREAGSAPETPSATPRARTRRQSAGSSAGSSGGSSAASAAALSNGNTRAASPAAAPPSISEAAARAQQRSTSATGAAAAAAAAATPGAETPEGQQWEGIRKLRGALEAGLAGEGGPQALAEALRALVGLVDARTRAFDLRATSVPKRLQFVLHLLGRIMAAPEAHKHPDIQARLCKLYLILAPGGAVLTSTAKTVYAISKDKANDARFGSEGLVEGVLEVLGRAPSASVEVQALLFLCGALKHTSESEPIRQTLVALNAIEPLAALVRPEALKALLEQAGRESKDKGRTKVAQLLVQVTAALRNVAVNAREAKQAFVDSGAVASLCGLLGDYADHAEVALNVCRILSKLTLFPEYPNNAALVVRACFILGNLTGDDERPRVAIAAEHKAVEPLVRLLIQYADMDAAACADEADKSTQTKPEDDPQQQQQQEGEKKKEQKEQKEQQKATGATLTELEQVLIKLIRLLANVAISREAGPVVAATRGIEVLCSLLERKSPVTHEELVLNIVGAITNFSFYATPSNIILQHQSDISYCTPLPSPSLPLFVSPHLFALLESDNDESVIESVRAFGNFSRSEAVRAVMVERRIDEVMSILLEHHAKEVAFNACGVLMNLATDRARLRPEVVDETVPRLLRLLSEHGASDADTELLVVACKTLFNLCIDDGASGASGASGAAGSNALSLTQLAELKRVLERIGAPAAGDEGKAELAHVTTQLARLNSNAPLVALAAALALLCCSAEPLGSSSSSSSGGGGVNCAYTAVDPLAHQAFHYDLTPLRHSPGAADLEWAVESNSSSGRQRTWRVYGSVCGATTAAGASYCAGSAVCAKGLWTWRYWSYGALASQSFCPLGDGSGSGSGNSSSAEGNASAGLALTYEHGDPCGGSGSSGATRQTTIELLCDAAAEALPLASSMSADECRLTLRLRSRHACGSPVPYPSPSSSSSSSGSSDSSSSGAGQSGAESSRGQGSGSNSGSSGSGRAEGHRGHWVAVVVTVAACALAAACAAAAALVWARRRGSSEAGTGGLYTSLRAAAS
eukprot:m51a1_g7765 hypothetical protein (1123) ;mRNA; r:132563-137716